MSENFVSMRNLKFLLYEVFDIESLTKFPYYEEHGKEIFDMVLDTAIKMGKDMMRPALQEMDQNPPELVDGRVKVHPLIKSLMKEYGEGGWISAELPFEAGGQQLPIMLTRACEFIFAAANYSTSTYSGLTTGAADLIETFGSEEMKEIYLPKMFSGEWQGTMALTEPQAGSSLSDVMTLAIPTDEGYYNIQGQKLFISAGDHDGVDNVIHLLLAKIKGAPPGVKGISLFVVPRERLDENGNLTFNDFNTTAIYHKLGYRGTPIVQLSLGDNKDCRGYLVGEPNKGLAYMFQMMNGARIGVGLGATAIATAAYYAALEYSKERPQGRKISAKDPSQPQIPIIEHADVKRMLLFQRSVVEGSLSLLMQCCRYSDYEKISTSDEEKEKYALLLDLLTPVAKTYPSEMGILSVSQGLQCLGGYGYCDEFPLEQYYRDVRIHPIHEGTTGIQGMDLLGRKVIMKKGKAYQLYLEEVQKTLEDSRAFSELEPQAKELEDALQKLQATTSHLLGIAGKGDMELFLADATIYLEFFGIISIAWQWLVQAIRATNALQGSPSDAENNFYNGKLYTFRYFFDYELPKIEGLIKLLTKSSGVTVEMKENYFSD